jgi:hypothetical protein
VLFGSIAWTQAANYYISASGPVGSGNGSSAANAADASTPPKYNAIVNAQNAPGTVIVYAAGTYLQPSGCQMFNGVTHQGAGIDKTIIQLAAGSQSSTFAPMWNAPSQGGSLSNWKIFDVTMDVNAVNQPGWASGNFKTQVFFFPLADHCTIQRVKFINIGSKSGESFPIFFGASTSSPGNMNNNLIDSCIFSNPVPSGNTDGLTCIQMADAEPFITVDNTNIVSNNQFINLCAGYADFQYTQCCSCPVATGNTAVNVDAFWFIEPGSNSAPSDNVFFTGQTVQVTGNTVTNGILARIFMHPNGNFAGNLNIKSNQVTMSQYPYAYYGGGGPLGVTFDDYTTGNPPIGSVTIQSNTFTAPSPPWTAKPVAVLVNPSSRNLFHLASLTVINNRFVNFPGDGSEIQVNTAQVGIYRNTGNTFTSSP